MEWILNHWAEVGLAIMVLDKIVIKTPCKWDDLIFTAIKEALGAMVPNRFGPKSTESPINKTDTEKEALRKECARLYNLLGSSIPKNSALKKWR